MHKTLIYVLSSGQDIHAQDIHVCSVLRTSSPCTRHSFMFRPKHTWMSCAWITCHEYRTLMSALCMENLTLGQDINECLVHGELALRTGHKWMAQDIRLCPVLRTSSPCTRHSFMFRPKDKFSMHNTLIYVLSSGQVLHYTSALCMENLSLGTGHKWMPCAWRTCPSDRT
jgi:hypothetical protein